MARVKEPETFFTVLAADGHAVCGYSELTDRLELAADELEGGYIVDQDGNVVYPPAQLPEPMDAKPVDEEEDA